MTHTKQKQIFIHTVPPIARSTCQHVLCCRCFRCFALSHHHFRVSLNSVIFWHFVDICCAWSFVRCQNAKILVWLWRQLRTMPQLPAVDIYAHQRLRFRYIPRAFLFQHIRTPVARTQWHSVFCFSVSVRNNLPVGISIYNFVLFGSFVLIVF